MRVVLACGCFDLLHVAHKRHLEQARQMGDFLIVAVTMDKYVNKKGRPIIPEKERLEMVKSLQCVSQAALSRDSIDALNRWTPDVFVKGNDYKRKGLLAEEVSFCKEHGVKIAYTNYNSQSTTKIVERIRCVSA